MSVPTTQKGVLCSATSRTIAVLPVSEPGNGEVLIQNVSVASNPKDWVYSTTIPDYNFVEGSDTAGIIAKVGPGVTKFNVGDRVAAFCKAASKDNKNGTYQQYTIAQEHVLISLPDNMTYEEASTIPLAATTSAMALFDPNSLGLPSPFEEKEPATSNQGIKDITLVINGASSSIGSYGIQLAKFAGFKVIGICGAGGDYAKELGADIVIDYRDKSGDQLVQELESHGPFSFVYDCVSTVDTLKFLSKALQAQGGGKIESVLPTWLRENLEDICNLEKNIFSHMTYAGQIHTIDGSPTVYDTSFSHEFAANCSKYLTNLIKHGHLQPNKIRLMPYGLESVAEGLSLLQNKKVSAEKLVYNIKDTPRLD